MVPVIFRLSILKVAAIIVTAVFLDFITLSDTNRQILPPPSAGKMYDERRDNVNQIVNFYQKFAIILMYVICLLVSEAFK